MTAEAAKSAKAGAPEAEIEITSEMIEAAADVLLRYDPLSDSLYVTAASVLRAAYAAQRFQPSEASIPTPINSTGRERR